MRSLRLSVHAEAQSDAGPGVLWLWPIRSANAVEPLRSETGVLVGAGDKASFHSIRTWRGREVDFFLSFCILRNDWKKSFENFNLIQEELDKGLSIDNCLQSSSRTTLRKCDLLTDLIQ